MADAVQLTDAELRRQLIQLGAKTVGPITATTRPIYVKKLNHLKVAARKAGSGVRASTGGVRVSGRLAALSSDSEPSDGETDHRHTQTTRSATTNKNRPANNRRTVNNNRGRETSYRNSPSQPAATTGRSGSRSTRVSRRRDSDSENEENTTAGRSLTRTAGASMRSSTAVTSHNASSNNNSFSNWLGRPPLRSRFNNSEVGNHSTASFNMQTSLDSSRERLLSGTGDNEFSDTDYDETDIGDEMSPERATVSTNTSPRMDDSSLFNRTLSRLGVWGSGGDRKRYHGNSSDVGDQSYGVSPRVASVYKSPLTLAIDSYRDELRNRDDQTNHRPNDRTSPTTTIPSRATTSNNTRQRITTTPNHAVLVPPEDKLADEEIIKREGFKTQEDPGGYGLGQNISVVLLVLVSLFFVVLAAVYILTTHPIKVDVADVPSKDVWLICPADPSEAHGSEACYSRADVESARDVVLELAEMLSIRAGDYECGRSSRRNMTRTEAKTRLVNKWGTTLFGDMGKKYNFLIALHLLHKNPHWKINLYNNQAEVAVRHTDTAWLESEVPYYGLVCQMKQVALTTCYILAAILSAALIGYLCWWRIRRREEETRSMHHLVEQIIDIMKSHHDKCQNNSDMQPYLAIPHVRDMLIGPKDRRRLQSRWDRAVKFLSANESRIRVESQKISGEDFAVWRWLQTHSNGKVWQGPAFGENREASFPNIRNCKFQCLKIRNMFDPDVECDDDWHVHIEDAILEKVSMGDGEHGVVHIAVDKTSREGCVYVKCASAQHAAKAYMALHGWWFDSNLVTVKYLRTERYYERYPHAAHNNAPLSPSNNQRRSLSQPFHRSIYESC